jgi:hypothetical protein
MPPIRRPPLLGIGHQCPKISLEGVVIKLLEGLGIVEAGPEGIGSRMVLMQQTDIDLLGPPLLVGRTTGWGHRTHMAAEGTLQL